MNRKQKIVLWLGIFTIVLMCLFPPWIKTTKTKYPGGQQTKVYTRHSFHFLIAAFELPTDIYLSYNHPFCFLIDAFESPTNESFSNSFSKTEQIITEQVNLLQLCIQCAIAALITVGLLFTFTTKEKYKHKEQKVEIRK